MKIRKPERQKIPNLVTALEPVQRDDVDILHAVIETPQGSRNKYKYDEESGLFILSKVLPAGSQFPYSFGFIPKTLAEDGDPLDVLVLTDEPVPVGCVVPCRVIGVLRAEQSEGNRMTRNDRLIAVAEASRNLEDVTSFRKISPGLRREIEHFFVSYNQVKGKQFKVLDCCGPSGGRHTLDEALAEFKRRRGRNRSRAS
jgi:inorganic pyrophosphatase